MTAPVKRPVDVRTPVATGDAEKVGKGLWRKQVLPNATLNVRGRVIAFTPDYFREVAQAFSDEAFPTVPFMLADRNNDHTMEPERAHGEVLGLDAADDGLYATIRLSEVAERIVRDNPRFGVSVRIKENWDRADGKHYPAAMQHLLGTFDAVAPSMKPWEPVDLAEPAGQAVLLDLSSMTYDQPAVSGETPTSGGEPTMATLTDEELAKVRVLLQRVQNVDRPTDDDGSNGDGSSTADDTQSGDDDEAQRDDEAEDAYFARLAEKYFGGLGDEGQPDDGDDDAGDTDVGDEPAEGDINDEGEGEGNTPAEQQERQTVAAATTASDGDVIELANTGRDEDRQRILDLTNQLDAANYEKEREQLVKQTGLPPSVIDLARPVLEGRRRVVELSNGSQVDAGDVVRKVLHAVGQKIQLLDLSAALGTDEPDDEAKAAAEHRSQVADRVLQYIN
jgi:hypothetical protein